MATISEALAIALAHHQAGRLPAAEQVYRQILAVNPEQPDALHLLGVLAYHAGRYDFAIEHIQRAIRVNGTEAIYHNNLGNVWRERRNPSEAIACYRRAVQLDPAFVKAHYNLGIALKEQGRFDEAVVCYQQALHLQPDAAEAHNNLGNAWRESGRLDEAVACYRHAIELKPDLIEAHFNLGIALRDQGAVDEAIACYRRVLQLKRDDAMALNNLGNALQSQGKVDEALACYRQALQSDPGYAEGHNNLGIALKDQGRLAEAIRCCQTALQLRPDLSAVHGNWAYMLYFCPEYDATAIAAEHRRWNRQFAAPLARCITPHANERSPERRLRVGYVSPDLRWHPVGRFVLPLLAAHDHEHFEVLAYSSVRTADAITAECRRHADQWRDVRGLSDEQLAEAIRGDAVDILVDLTMHMAHNRLLAFARKPAPVQVTYLAYCGTTGLEAMDYRLTDPYLDPPGEDPQIYCEQSAYLPETYWCYQPVEPSPAVNRVPALTAGHVTFGCLNNFCKVSAPTLAAWGRILQALPESRLLLHCRSGSHRAPAAEYFERQGVAQDGLEFVDFLPIREFLEMHGRIDIALDPFPYGGGTTTCDALWMGVPLVTLAGRTAVGRGGVSILSNLGLTDLVAGDVEQYVGLATCLAQDLSRLTELRATLRERMQQSPLMNATRYAENVETCYRRMWRAWCAL